MWAVTVVLAGVALGHSVASSPPTEGPSWVEGQISCPQEAGPVLDVGSSILYPCIFSVNFCPKVRHKLTFCCLLLTNITSLES